MAIGINRHNYNELYSIRYIYHKTGKVNILWGLIKFPTGWHEEKKIRKGVCRNCLQPKLKSIHGFNEDLAGKEGE